MDKLAAYRAGFAQGYFEKKAGDELLKPRPEAIYKVLNYPHHQLPEGANPYEKDRLTNFATMISQELGPYTDLNHLDRLNVPAAMEEAKKLNGKLTANSNDRLAQYRAFMDSMRKAPSFIPVDKPLYNDFMRGLKDYEMPIKNYQYWRSKGLTPIHSQNRLDPVEAAKVMQLIRAGIITAQNNQGVPGLEKASSSPQQLNEILAGTKEYKRPSYGSFREMSGILNEGIPNPAELNEQYRRDRLTGKVIRSLEKARSSGALKGRSIQDIMDPVIGFNNYAAKHKNDRMSQFKEFWKTLEKDPLPFVGPHRSAKDLMDLNLKSRPAVRNYQYWREQGLPYEDAFRNLTEPDRDLIDDLIDMGVITAQNNRGPAMSGTYA